MSSASSSVMTAIADHLLRFSADNTRVSTLLTLCVGRVLLNASRRGEDWQRLVRDEDIAHIVDWLKAAVVNDSPWLDNTDDKGRPKKLMKFSSIDAITAEVNRDMLRTARSGSAKPLIEGDEALHADLGDGYSLVRLLTPAALDRESAQMQHCIGNGAYDDQLGSDDHLFLSLRDPRGKPHATLEIEGSKILQLQGKQNNPPVKRYVDRIVPFIQDKKYEVDIPAYHLGYVIDVHGKWHAIDNLPEGLTVGGGLSLSDTTITALPDGLKVGGDLSLYGTPITELPEGLKVGGDLSLYGTPITELPEGLKVGGGLSLRRTSITVLPKGLKVGGWLDLYDTPITSLPDSISDDVTVYTDAGKMKAAEFRLLNGRALEPKAF